MVLKEFGILLAIAAVGWSAVVQNEAQRRSFFKGSSSNNRPREAQPVWKVHKYNGIHLSPIRVEENIGEYPAPREPEEPPSVINLETEYGTPAGGDDEEDSSAALQALDSLGPLANLLPGGDSQGSGGVSSLFINKFSTLLRGVAGPSPASTQLPYAAQEKVGVVPILIAKDKKKKKDVIGLIALANALKAFRAGKLPFQSGGEEESDENGATATVPYGTTVYRDVPTSSSSHSWFSWIPFLRNRQQSSLEFPRLPSLPNIPNLPNFKLVPEAPKLPQIRLPGKYRGPVSSGAYVSIRLPRPESAKTENGFAPLSPPVAYGPPQEEFSSTSSVFNGPAAEYGPPATSYGVPVTGPYPPPSGPYPPASGPYPPASGPYPPTQPSSSYEQPNAGSFNDPLSASSATQDSPVIQDLPRESAQPSVYNTHQNNPFSGSGQYIPTQESARFQVEPQYTEYYRPSNSQFLIRVDPSSSDNFGAASETEEHVVVPKRLPEQELPKTSAAQRRPLVKKVKPVEESQPEKTELKKIKDQQPQKQL